MKASRQFVALLLTVGVGICVGVARGQEAATQESPATQTSSGEPYASDASVELAQQQGTALTLAPNLRASPPIQGSPNSTDVKLEEAASRPAGLLPYGPVSILDPMLDKFNAATDKYGLNVGFAFTTVYQAASGGPGERDAAGMDFDLFGAWRLLGGKDDPNKGSLYFAAESRNSAWTDIAPSALGGEIGSLWGTTNGFGEQDLQLKELYWQQNINNDRLIVRVGTLDPENYYNSNYWQSDSKYFLMKSFSSFPVRAFPGNGLGFNITTKLSDEWYVSTGVQDAQGRKGISGFNTFFDDFDLFGAGEVGFTPKIEGWGRGTYRATLWYRAAGETTGTPHDAGFNLSFDQHIGAHWVPFFRYGWGQGNINNIDEMISTGVGWEGKMISESDVIGIGGTWGKQANGGQDSQYGMEVFYRLQVSPDNQFTVGYQIIVDPVNQPNDDVVGVFEVRWRITM